MKLSVIKLIFFFLLGLDFFISKAQCNRFPYPYSITIPDCNTNSYSLKFKDNFNGNSLDLNKWMLPQFGLGTKAGAGSQQLYTFDSDNVEVSNGTLKIKVQNQPKMGRVIGYCPPQCVPCATEQDIDNCILSDGLPNLRVFSYSSSSLWSIKNDFLEGKYEIRCRISKGRGLWPAFWTFSGDSGPGGTIWSEHDLFEIYYDQKMPINDDPLGVYRNNFKYTNNIQFDLNNDGNTGGEQCRYREVGLDFSVWHTYTIYFENDKIEYFIDGNFVNRKVRYRTVDGISISCGDGTIATGSAWDITGWPRQPMQLILNMNIQRGINAPNDPSIFPATFEIDYVRYWKKDPVAVPCQHDIIKLYYPFSGYSEGNNGLVALGAKVSTGYNAELVARGSITFLRNFEVELGAKFVARIDPVICGTARLADTTNYKNLKNYNKLVTNNIIQPNNNSSVGVTIYPNPTQGKFTLTIKAINSNSLVEVYDIMGKKIWRKTVSKDKTQIDISTQPKGIYLVKVVNGNKILTQKVIYE